MSAAVRSIHIPGEQAFEWLRSCAQKALDAWAREWVIVDESRGLPTVEVGVADRTSLSLAHEYEAVHTEAGCIWFRCSALERLSLANAVVGAELMPRANYADNWIAEVVDSAWKARRRALTSALLGVPMTNDDAVSTTHLPAALFAVGAGSVQVSCDELGLNAIADSGVWRSVPPTQRDTTHQLPALSKLDRASHRAQARLEVVLGSTEVDLPRLVDLRCGDVLRLPQRLDAGIAVLCEGNLVAHAALGQARGRVCVQIVSNAS